MEKFLEQNQSLLGLIQAQMDEQMMDRSVKAGEELWAFIHKLVETHELSVIEMLNMAIACNLTILESAFEETKEVVEGMESNG